MEGHTDRSLDNTFYGLYFGSLLGIVRKWWNKVRTGVVWRPGFVRKDWTRLIHLYPRKYIPIDVATVEETCDKAFVNVYATNLDETDALLCCNKNDPQNPSICQPPVRIQLVLMCENSLVVLLIATRVRK